MAIIAMHVACFLNKDEAMGGETICSRGGCRDFDQHVTGLPKFSTQCRLLAGGTLCTLQNQLCYEVVTVTSIIVYFFINNVIIFYVILIFFSFAEYHCQMLSTR
jgi:hypothetical protein